MDGVLSDTQKFHAEVESKLLHEFGIKMSPQEITSRYAGVSDEQMFKEIFSNHHVEVSDLNNLIFRKWDLMAEVSRGRIDAIPYAIDLVTMLSRNNYKMAVASASTKGFIEIVLKALNIRDYFDTVVSAQEVANGKPAPDIFILAADRLGVAHSKCVVIEDGKSGMIGARAAGMKCIGLVPVPANNIPADIIVSSLKEISLKMMQEIL